MHSEDDAYKRRLERHVRRSRFLDPETGDELTCEQVSEVVERIDGTLETLEQENANFLHCRHLHRLGQSVSRCEPCSEGSGSPRYVCSACAVVDPVTGVSACLRCTRIGPDGRRYTETGLKMAKELRLFEKRSTDLQKPESPVATDGNRRVRRGLFTRLLEWW